MSFVTSGMLTDTKMISFDQQVTNNRKLEGGLGVMVGMGVRVIGGVIGVVIGVVIGGVIGVVIGVVIGGVIGKNWKSALSNSSHWRKFKLG